MEDDKADRDEPGHGAGFSRRSFLKATGITAIGALAVEQVVAASGSPVKGPGPVWLDLKVNGRVHKV